MPSPQELPGSKSDPPSPLTLEFMDWPKAHAKSRLKAKNESFFYGSVFFLR